MKVTTAHAYIAVLRGYDRVPNFNSREL